MIFNFRKKQKAKWPGLVSEKVGGKTWVYFSDPLKAPHSRILAYAQVMDEVQLGIQRKDLEGFVEIQRQAFNAGDFTKAAAYLEYMWSFIDLYAAEDNVIKLGCTFIMLKGEPVNKLEPRWIEKKTKLAQSSEEVRAFFLRLSLKQMPFYKKQRSDIDLTEYFRSPGVKEAAYIFLNLVRSNISKTKRQKQTKP